MNMQQRQSGLSLPSILVIVVMIGFFVTCGLKMAPNYIEYLQVKKIIAQVASEHDPATENVADIRRRIANLFNTNQIYAIQPRDVEVFRKDGRTFIDANYEGRIPIMWRIDAVLRYDDLQMEAGVTPSQ